MSKQIINSAIVSALNVALYGGGRPSKPRVKLSEERLSTLAKIHNNAPAFLILVQNYNGAPNYRVKNAVENAIRNWIPEEVETKWLAKDAKAFTANFNRPRRAPFNPIRVIA